jgi:hypothetical protein
MRPLLPTATSATMSSPQERAYRATASGTTIIVRPKATVAGAAPPSASAAATKAPAVGPSKR